MAHINPCYKEARRGSRGNKYSWMGLGGGVGGGGGLFRGAAGLIGQYGGEWLPSTHIHHMIKNRRAQGAYRHAPRPQV